MAMAVRPAVVDDIPMLLPLLEEFSRFAATRPSLYPGDDDAAKTLDLLITGHLVLVAESLRDGIVGFIAGLHAPHWMNPRITTLAEVLWYVDERHRSSRAGLLLFDAFLAEGQRCADWVVFTLEANSPVHPHHLTRRGFREQERSFLCEVAA